MLLRNLFSSTVKTLGTAAFLLILTACGGGSQSTDSGAPSSAQEQTVYEWKLITSWPKNLQALGTSPEHFADIV